MRAVWFSAPELRTSARQAWVGWPEPDKGEVVGPVKIGFDLTFPAIADAVSITRFLRAPRPELVWLMGVMETQLDFQCDSDPMVWQLAGRTQAVWLTLPLLEGFLLALWQQTHVHRGVLEGWAFHEP